MPFFISSFEDDSTYGGIGVLYMIISSILLVRHLQEDKLLLLGVETALR